MGIKKSATGLLLLLILIIVISYGCTPEEYGCCVIFDESGSATCTFDTYIGDCQQNPSSGFYPNESCFNVGTCYPETTTTILDDSDNDGISDETDNCIDKVNPNQLDTDNDDYGNACDCDLNNDGTCNTNDQNIFNACYAVPPRIVPTINGPADDPTCEGSDMDGDGLVGLGDWISFTSSLNNPPGPSCIDTGDCTSSTTTTTSTISTTSTSSSTTSTTSTSTSTSTTIIVQSNESEWNRTYDFGSYDQAEDIAIDSSDNLYVVGHKDTSDWWIMKINNNGVSQWNRTYDSGSSDDAWGVAIDSSDNVYVAGYETQTDSDWRIMTSPPH